MDDRLREIEERASKATPGSWKLWDGWGPVGESEYWAVNYIGPDGVFPTGIIANVTRPLTKDIYAKVEDFEFVAHAREDIPWLIQQLRLLRVLADGCPKHPSYRAKRKVNTICETCNAMWEARAALEEQP